MLADSTNVVLLAYIYFIRVPRHINGWLSWVDLTWATAYPHLIHPKATGVNGYVFLNCVSACKSNNFQSESEQMFADFW